MLIYNEKNQIINHEQIEHIEQQLASKWIKPESRVLELGARYGSVSIVTNKIVEDKSSHYVVEPDSEVWECLEKNMKINDCNFNIIKGIIGNRSDRSKKKYRLEGDGYEKRSVIDSTYGKSQIESFDLPNVNFNTLIADCEGFLETFFDENKQLFHDLELIIIECDQPQRCNYKRLIKEFFELDFVIVEHINHYGLDHYVFKKSILK